MKAPPPFQDRVLSAPREPAFALQDYWVWCGSVIRGEDGLYHMFASRWPKDMVFFTGYKLASEIVHAVSDAACGPYAFKEVVLPDRGERFWDGRVTHNPAVLHCQDRYLLFYLGGSFRGERPVPAEISDDRHPKADECYASFRIGVAEAPSPNGPWTRFDHPILEPRPGKWDHAIVTNPAPCVCPDGRILLYYRSNTPRGCRLGVAAATRWGEPFHRLRDDPLLEDISGGPVEDPFVWWNGQVFEMICKDLTGTITGELHAGVHAWSEDGVDWRLAPNPKAYSRVIEWHDGTSTRQGCFERPQLLFHDGQPTHLFAATADGPGGFANAARTWNMVVPLKPY